MKQRYNPRRDLPFRLARYAEVVSNPALDSIRGKIQLAQTQASQPKLRLKPADLDAKRNPLRPGTLNTMIGQDRLKPLLRRLIDATISTGRPLDHMLLVGASGTGKTTVALVVARELGTRVFTLKAPVDMEHLTALADSAGDGDLVFVDEIHMMVSGDRRGITQACDPENFYLLLEDGLLMTAGGGVPFPHVTWIGATTDVGLLPEALTNRFPLQPRLQPYTERDMTEIAWMNARALNQPLESGVAELFGGACRLNPRQLNSYMRSAQALAGGAMVSQDLATEVVTQLAGSTLDGLTDSMQTVLRFLYTRCARELKGQRVYSASVNTLATACGHGRDTKAISLLVEPYLLQRGLLEVRSTGRTLTPEGVQRAIQLCTGVTVPAETPAARALRTMGRV